MQDVVKELCELIMVNGPSPQMSVCIGLLRMLTNSDKGGVERISISCLRPQLGAKPRYDIKLADLEGSEAETAHPVHCEGMDKDLLLLHCLRCLVFEARDG